MRWRNGPDYDEYGISYKDREEIFDAHQKHISRGNLIFNRMLVVNGRIAGSWQKQVVKNRSEIRGISIHNTQYLATQSSTTRH